MDNLNEGDGRFAMVSVNEVCKASVASKVAGISTAAVSKRVSEGIVMPAIQGDGRGTMRFYSFQQVLAMRLHREAIEAGIRPAIAREILRTIETLPNLEEMVESGKHYLCGDCQHLVKEPMTLEESRKWYQDRQAAREAPDSKGNISLEFRIDFGMTWRAIKPLLIERAAGQRRKAATGGRTDNK